MVQKKRTLRDHIISAMSEIRTKRITLFIGALISTWGINACILSLSRSGASLVKLSILAALGPLASFIIYDPPAYSYILVPAFCLGLIAGVIFSFKKIHVAIILFGTLLLFIWFFIAVLIFEMD